ncbi:MAG TPA: PQQ-binding-like beta-propeller repeat protein [Vicinamibacterales bacterium]|nr:PQQ-binding-like beta-propeller repeat protein [Vicinamibacterales bacterium]
MSRTFRLTMAGVALAVALLTITAGVSGQIFLGTAPPAGPGGQPSTAAGEWPQYNADIRGTRYSPLDQINTTNFGKLEVAWRFKTDSFGPRPEFKLEGTPIMVKGVLYSTAGVRRAVVALDAKTGEVIWTHSVREGKRAVVSPRQLSGRGVSYWTDGRGDDRIVYFTTGYRMIELNAKTGTMISSFGTNGVVDLKQGVVMGNRQPIDLETGEIGIHSTPAIARDVIIVGSSFREGQTVPTHNNTKGLVRAYDARTGKLLWTFNTIPRPGELGNETWENDSWSTNGNTGVWTQISVDEDLGLVYLPVETPSSDFYGGHRPGDNLFAETLVAVDLKTGQRKWHYQYVHHPIWNFDNSSSPILMDINVDGRPVKVVASPSKQAYLYVLDRVTGKPVWPIEERPVPQSDIPGEKTAATQPFPTKPPAYGRNFLRVPDDLIDFTPELRAQALDVLKRYRVGTSPFTPPMLGSLSGILGAVGAGTATNWPGSAGDPETHVVYAQASNAPSSRSLVAPPAGFSDIRYVAGIAGRPFREVLGPGDCCAADGSGKPFAPTNLQAAPAGPAPTPEQEAVANAGLTVQGLPIYKPPYGVLSAINLDKGEITWQVPAGDTPDNVRNHPALRGLTIPKTGQPGVSGVGLMVTKSIVVMGDPQITTTPDHPRGAMLRAYDKKDGREVGAVFMPAPQSGSPMTYMVDGRQYIVVAVSGGSYSGEYIAFSLPGNSGN